MSKLADVESRSWAWLFEHAWRPNPETKQRLRLNVPDTVLFSEAEPTLWLFTTKEGELKRKSSDKLKMTLIRDQLLLRASEMVARSENIGRPRQPSHEYVAVVRYGSARTLASEMHAIVLDEVTVDKMAKDRPGGILSLQLFVPTRAESGSRFRCEAIRDAHNKLRFRCEKLCYLGNEKGAPHPRSQEVSDESAGAAAFGADDRASTAAFALKSNMRGFNSRLEESVARLVAHLEAVSHVRVVSIEADFIQDATREGHAEES